MLWKEYNAIKLKNELNFDDLKSPYREFIDQENEWHETAHGRELGAHEFRRVNAKAKVFLSSDPSALPNHLNLSVVPERLRPTYDRIEDLLDQTVLDPVPTQEAANHAWDRNRAKRALLNSLDLSEGRFRERIRNGTMDQDVTEEFEAILKSPAWQVGLTQPQNYVQGDYSNYNGYRVNSQDANHISEAMFDMHLSHLDSALGRPSRALEFEQKYTNDEIKRLSENLEESSMTAMTWQEGKTNWPTTSDLSNADNRKRGAARRWTVETAGALKLGLKLLERDPELVKQELGKNGVGIPDEIQASITQTGEALSRATSKGILGNSARRQLIDAFDIAKHSDFGNPVEFEQEKVGENRDDQQRSTDIEKVYDTVQQRMQRFPQTMQPVTDELRFLNRNADVSNASNTNQNRADNETAIEKSLSPEDARELVRGIYNLRTTIINHAKNRDNILEKTKAKEVIAQSEIENPSTNQNRPADSSDESEEIIIRRKRRREPVGAVVSEDQGNQSQINVEIEEDEAQPVSRLKRRRRSSRRNPIQAETEEQRQVASNPAENAANQDEDEIQAVHPQGDNARHADGQVRPASNQTTQVTRMPPGISPFVWEQMTVEDRNATAAALRDFENNPGDQLDERSRGRGENSGRSSR